MFRRETRFFEDALSLMRALNKLQIPYTVIKTYENVSGLQGVHTHYSHYCIEIHVGDATDINALNLKENWSEL